MHDWQDHVKNVFDKIMSVKTMLDQGHVCQLVKTMFDKIMYRTCLTRPYACQDHAWTSLHMYHVWTNLNQFYPFGFNLIQFNQVWTNLIQFDPVWSNLIQFDQVCTMFQQHIIQISKWLVFKYVIATNIFMPNSKVRENQGFIVSGPMKKLFC